MQTQNSQIRDGELDSQSGQFFILSDFTECCSGNIYTAKLPPPHHTPHPSPLQLNVHKEEKAK